MSVDVILDSDVVIWHLRGRPTVVQQVNELAAEVRIGVSAITRAEVLRGMRDPERDSTLKLLDSFETLPIDVQTADRAAEIIRHYRQRGFTSKLPDALIAATAILARAPLYTGNTRDFPSPELELRALDL